MLNVVYTPQHTIVQAASGSAFFDLVDNFPPFMQDFALPDPKDFKKDKFGIVLTQMHEPKLNLKNFLDKGELLDVLDAFSRGYPGMKVGEESYKPILNSMKGSPDNAYKHWAFTSRITTVKYELIGKERDQPGYMIEIKHQEGQKFGNGMVKPSQNRDGTVKLSFALPMETAKRMGKQGMLYLEAREVNRQALWARSRDRMYRLAETDNTWAQTAQNFDKAYRIKYTDDQE